MPHTFLNQRLPWDRRWWLPLLLGALMLVPWKSEAESPSLVIPAGREDDILGLFEPLKLGGEFVDGYRWEGLSIEVTGFTALVVPADSKGAENIPEEVRLTWKAIPSRAAVLPGAREEIQTEVTVVPRQSQLSEPARAAIARMREVVDPRLGEEAWRSLMAAPSLQKPAEEKAQSVWPLPAALLLLLALLSHQFRPGRRRFNEKRREASTAASGAGSPPTPARSKPSEGAGASSESSTPSDSGLKAWLFKLFWQPGNLWTIILNVVILALALVLVHPYATAFRSSGLIFDNYRETIEMERVFVALLLLSSGMALSVLVARAVVAAPIALRLRTRRKTIAVAVVDVGLVGAWSLFVRLGLTQVNILTDGGSGWGRLLQYSRGYNGFSTLVTWILPEGPMLEAIVIPQVTAALSAPLLVLIARELGIRRGASLLAGLALGCLPVHAAMYSSDFGTGAVLSVLMLGLWLLLRGRRLNDALAIVTGSMVLAWGIWGRPEALAVGLPAAVALLPLRSRLLTPAIFGGLVWLAASAALRLQTLSSLGGDRDLVLTWVLLPEGAASAATSPVVMPWWLWVSIPFMLLAIPRRAVPFIVAFAVFAYSPFLTVSPGKADSMEMVRYGTAFLVLFALLAGIGWEWLGRTALSAGWSRDWTLSRVLPRRVAGGVLLGLIALPMLATPLMNRDYLSRVYGPTFEYHAFTSALQQASGSCLMVVPDDDADDATGSMEIAFRYHQIAREASAAGVLRFNFNEVMPASRFLSDPIEKDCVLFFAGVACIDGGPVDPVTSCRDMERRFEMEPIASFPTEYFSHRMIARPNDRNPPQYDPDFALTMYRVERERDADRPVDSTAPGEKVGGGLVFEEGIAGD